jgi:hypothetical protein
MDGQQEKSALTSEVGMPPDASTYTLSLTDKELGRQWKGYRVTLTGLLVSHLPDENPEWPSYKLQDSNESNSGKTLQVWQQVVVYKNSPAFGEVRWHPQEGLSVAIRGVENIKEETDFPRTWQGLLLLSKAPWQGTASFLTLKRKRRPEGSGKLRELTPKQLREKYNALRGEYTRMKYGPPTLEDVASNLSVGRTTLYRYLKRHGIQWPPI